MKKRSHLLRRLFTNKVQGSSSVSKFLDKRHCRFEKLELREMLSANPIPDFSGIPGLFSSEPQLDITTTDNPVNHIVTPGTGLDGVVRLDITTSGGGGICTGTLLPDGLHVLTAAHCVAGGTNGAIDATSVDVVFELLGGDVTLTSLPASFDVHPSWDGFSTGGNDIAILELPSLAPADATRFDILRTQTEFGQVIDLAGYGQAGQQQVQFGAGVKLAGNNVFEATFGSDILLYDFDSGLAANDVIGILTGGAGADLGLGQSESLAVGGDSGSPAFLNGLIAGVHSFRNTLSGGVGDAIPGLNGSFGEIAFDMRVSTKAAFIDSIVDEAGAPTVTDVRLDGTGWAVLDAYSFSSIVAAGEQLRPIFTENVNTLQIEFSENVITAGDGSELALRGKNDVVVPFDTFDYDAGSHVATWTFNTPLPDDKYAIHLNDSITDVIGNRLDGDWFNDTAGTPDDFMDDPMRAFNVGDGTAGSLNDEFRFHFALLAGDYDGDGVVELGGEAAIGDGDGDSDAGDAQDLAIGTNGDRLPLQAIGGADLNDDEVVDFEDLMIWQNGFGSFGGSGVAGDVDGDGDADGADFLLYQRAYNSRSAWFEGSINVGAGGSIPLVLEGLAPQITNLVISGSSSLHDPYSFDTVDGSGTQLQTVPVGGADTVSITFSELVNISADSLRLIGLTTANVPQLAEFSYDPMTMTATWRFESWALGDNYLISLPDSVTDVEGNLLDGEWTNPASINTVNSLVSTFPSGDGTAGGHFNFVATLLPGDMDLDNIVSLGLDVFPMLANWDQSGSSVDWTLGDFNGDQVVDQLDLDIAIAELSTNLQDVWILADLNGNFLVDVSDLNTINANIGMTGATYADGDLNGDGVVDIADVDLAFAQFGLGLSLVS